MRLFVFGLGYSSLHFVRTRSARFPLIAGTVRDRAKAERLAGEGLTVRRFDDAAYDPIGGPPASSRRGGNRIDGGSWRPESRLEAGGPPMAYDPAITTDLGRAEALLVSVPPGERDPVLEHFGDAIAAATSLRSIAYLSTVGVYGDHGGDWVDETTALRPVSARSRERVEAEAAWAAFGRRHGMAVNLLRLGGIYGPGRSAIDNLRKGTARRLVKPGQVFNRIHVEDISRAIEAALADGGAGGACNVTDDLPAPPQDVIAYAAGLIGVEPPPEIAFETAELSPMARSFYSENKRVDNGRLKLRLGVQLAYPTYREGLQALA